MRDGDARILAIIATSKDQVMPGGAPIFLVADIEQQQRLALLLGKILNAMAHDLEVGVIVLVRH